MGDVDMKDRMPATGAQERRIGPRRPARRPYAAPQIVHQERLETVAAECNIPGGKADPLCLFGFS
ncbi:MAG: hypothetical protein AAGN66_16795 [Acidobacteriota bacterium]